MFTLFRKPDTPAVKFHSVGSSDPITARFGQGALTTTHGETQSAVQRLLPAAKYDVVTGGPRTAISPWVVASFGDSATLEEVFDFLGNEALADYHIDGVAVWGGNGIGPSAGERFVILTAYQAVAHHDNEGYDRQDLGYLILKPSER